MQYVQREPWREQAEVACCSPARSAKAPALVRISPIEGPGVCGATHPLKVAAFGVGSAFGFADEGVRPPGSIPSASQLRWPIASQPVTSQPLPPPGSPAAPSMQQPRYVPSAEPRMLGAAGRGTLPAAPRPVGARCRSTRRASIRMPSRRANIPIRSVLRWMRRAPPIRRARRRDPRARSQPELDDEEMTTSASRRGRASPAAVAINRPLPPLGPPRGPRVTSAAMPVEIKPTATLACPIVSALDRWIAGAVQPAALQVVRPAGRRDQADLGLFVPRHERAGRCADLRACVRQRARHRGLRARRRPPHHREGRLARLAGGAGLPARRAGRGLRPVHHGAGAGLQPVSTTTTSTST